MLTLLYYNICPPLEVILKANSLTYGLLVYVFTRAEKTTEMLDESLELRGIAVKFINQYRVICLMEDSKTADNRYEGGIEGVEAYLHKKLVSLA